MMLAALLGAAVITALPVQVESATCPSGLEIEQALATMLPSVSGAIRPDVASVLRLNNRMHVELLSPDETVIAERWLDSSDSCAELAELIAVVIASWESDVHPEFMHPHAEPSPVAAPEAPQPPAPSPAAFYEVAAGGSLSWAGSPALAGILTMGWIPLGEGPGLHVSALVESTHTLDMGVGKTANWQRFMGSAELDWRLPSGSWALDIHGGLALGGLAASGTGFPQNHSDYSFSPGGAAGARIAKCATQYVSIWLDLAVYYWPRQQILYGDPGALQHEIPHYQGLASIGLAFGRFPPRR